ncbi:mitochondrial RNA pseudouridine synthase RPUSD4-like [Nylanderia fulva]|uniref:mitochondrial RNA pseudouridine synthase RPUSD4-like n=1 Tax=Nylanderia fulva TaxID=613905 RepID=UPI0010FB12E3|nr:mitochondrial RNA pseudouridine synthase RPUSD4-like [Nylanderia fulva]XP_029167522.1 mitochondrial RNA pseudouridine synthase RPUSD4-like [Nylanderia fulva]
MTLFRIMRNSEFATTFCMYSRRYSTNILENECTTKKKVIHPYRQIHPWKSENEFANSLLKNVIYNADGIVAINKPYGIPIYNKAQSTDSTLTNCHKIVGAVDYSVYNVLPYLAKELDVPALIPCMGAEKYMTGIYVFGINNDACEQIEKARRRFQMGKFRKYWVVTSRVPHEIKGKYRLGMTLQKSALGTKKPIILTKWSYNAVKRQEVKILNINFRIISNSTHNLSSLIEMEASTKKWHSIRLFASTMLYSPILGDNYHGSRAQEIMGTWIKVNPFAESCWDMPQLNKQLLQLLDINENQQEIIPTHVHLRNIYLTLFGREKKDIELEAPLIHPFDWTCEQLMFKNIPELNKDSIENEVKISCV